MWRLLHPAWGRHQIVRTRPHARFLELDFAIEHRTEVRYARRDDVEAAGRKGLQLIVGEGLANP